MENHIIEEIQVLSLIWDFGKSKKDIHKIGDLYDFNNLMSDIWNKGLLSDIFDEYLGNFCN